VIYLDAHVAAWLYAGELDLFPSPVASILEVEDLVISPIVELELQYLHEVGRTSVPGVDVVAALEEELGLRRCSLRFDQAVTSALRLTWAHDPFDRLIVAAATVRRTQLITKDRVILEHYDQALWVE